jgi:hypothetical protein
MVYIYITTLVFDHAQLKHIGYLGYTIIDKEVICYPTITNGQHNTAQTHWLLGRINSSS